MILPIWAFWTLDFERPDLNQIIELGHDSKIKPTGPRKITGEESSYMIFLGRHIEIEDPRVFSLKGGFYWLFREKKIIQIGPREAAREFAEYSIVVSCLWS